MAENTTGAQSDGEEHLQARCSPELKHNARVAAAKRGISLSEYMRQLIREDTGLQYTIDD